jgi:hypothetical protein
MQRTEVNVVTGEITIHEVNPSEIPVPSFEEIQTQINQQSLSYLNSTDWYVVRFAETGVAIPVEILTARQNARESIK